MAYSVHIVRIDQGSKGKSRPITLDEWLAYVRSDGEMRLKGTFVATSPRGDTIKMDAPGLTKWIHSPTGNTAWFDHKKSGKISVGNPSPETLIKMFQVAETLGAIVQGDEGEHYDASGKRC